jgi:hypothetical protein
VQEQMDSTGNTIRLICEEAFMKKGFCESPICKETKFLFCYYDHLIYKHTVQDLAKYSVPLSIYNSESISVGKSFLRFSTESFMAASTTNSVLIS